MVRTNRSWPGTSMSERRRPSASSSWAYPRSIEMPRRRSSGSRSVSFPVSALTSQVLPWSMCPAVPTVRGMSAPGREHRCCDLLDLTVGQRAAVEERTPVADERDDRRLAGPKRVGEPLLDRACGARKLRQRKRAATDASDRVLDLATHELGESLGAGPDHVDRLVEHPQHGHGVTLRRIEAECERSLEGRERELVGTKRALEWVSSQSLDEVCPAHDHARLRAAEELVAGETDEIGACVKALRRSRLVADAAERARAEIVDERKLVAAHHLCELTELRPLREPDHPEVRLVHAEDESGLGTDRRVVVGRARPVGRPDLDEPRAGAREDVRDPEAVAYLDELAARHDDLTALRERREREQHGGRVV